MKALMILGSIVGFLIGSGFGMAANSSGPASFWRGCVAALIAAALTRWWGNIWLDNLRDSLHQRRNKRPSVEIKPAVKL
jgi:hypothetical protein